MLLLQEANNLARREEEGQDGQKRGRATDSPLEHELRVGLHRR